MKNGQLLLITLKLKPSVTGFKFTIFQARYTLFFFSDIFLAFLNSTNIYYSYQFIKNNDNNV
ncbi:hypothetical protein BpHYR1_017313 [Brachionus plicatilis]|uniref:Uncharacterized protein n=1 Tax=Brachionus plicatilis TaxID=10195 RepID=A0A3M7R4J4_BRAPC|nr:hypothetical protein BpHYR1_017313 [Brachionus plicatilis]